MDVYVNDVRVTHALDVRQTTNYQRVSAGAVRISLYPIDIDPAAQLSKPPLVSQTVNVSAGSSVSVVIANMGDGLTLIPVVEDASPLPSGMSRLTLLQANPGMLPVNILLPEAKRTLAQNLEVADIVGPIELPRADYRLELYDSANPDLFISDVSGINLTGQVNHLLVFVPAPPETLDLTETLLFTGSTRPVETDANTRFINAATEVGSLSLGWDGQSQITNLGVGEMSVAVPVSTRGTQALITNPQGNRVTDVQLGPWLGDLNDKIVLLLNAPESSLEPLTAISFSQNAPTSAIRANLRLIHALPDTVPLSLQTRIYRTETRTNDLGVAEVVRTDTPWEVVTANVPFGLASDYAGRAPDLYDVRVVLTGTETVIAQISLFQFLVGNAYDFVVAPGPEPGSANLLLVQPEVQVGVNGEDVTGPVLDEIVHATLTAMVTAAADTPTPVRTATPTISPVPTNTVYPSSTPSVHDPELLIDPAPPNTASGTFTLVGVNFAPNERYVISMDGGPDLLSGRVSPDGSLIAVVPLAPETTPGPHVVSVCVDCQRNGEQQARFVVVVVADPNTTLTPTAVP